MEVLTAQLEALAQSKPLLMIFECAPPRQRTSGLPIGFARPSSDGLGYGHDAQTSRQRHSKRTAAERREQGREVLAPKAGRGRHRGVAERTPDARSVRRIVEGSRVQGATDGRRSYEGVIGKSRNEGAAAARQVYRLGAAGAWLQSAGAAWGRLHHPNGRPDMAEAMTLADMGWALKGFR